MVIEFRQSFKNGNNRVAIVATSNPIASSNLNRVNQLVSALSLIGFDVQISEFLFTNTMKHPSLITKKAEELMELYKQDDISDIFDISGGDMSCEILNYIDFDIIACSKATYYGYSDITTIINSIYKLSNKKSILYNVYNILYDNSNINYFFDFYLRKNNTLRNFEYKFLQCNSLKGVVLGGNTRCLLKLAGTKFWPDFTGRVLFLESQSGDFCRINSYFCQLKQVGVFNQVSGVMLGEFSQLEATEKLRSFEILQRYISSDLPVVKTYDIGHNNSSKALAIGEYIELL